MDTNLVLTLIATVGLIAATALDRLLDREKHKRLYYWTLALATLLGLAGLWYGYSLERQRAEAEKAEKNRLEASLESITVKSDTLITMNQSLSKSLSISAAKEDTLLSDIADLRQSLQPFEEAARNMYPHLGQRSSLLLLRNDLLDLGRKIEDLCKPKITLVEETQPIHDKSTNLWVVRYVFRSKPAETLRDVQIRIEFDTPIDTAVAGVRADFLLGEWAFGIESNKLGVWFRKSSLQPGNDIWIDVASINRPNVTSLSLHPN